MTDTPSPSPDDRALATAIAERLNLDLPDACVAGVAANARLLEHHRARLAEPEA